MVRQRTDGGGGPGDHADLPSVLPFQEIPMKATATRSSRDALLDDFETVVTETEQLLKSAAGTGEEHAAALGATIERRVADATDRLARLRDGAAERAQAAADATDRFVQDNAWRSAGIAAGAGALVGLLLGAWIARR
jgi:ElaB/YqjD/DUF883 family membrane-anchored ribosome-binding protein